MIWYCVLEYFFTGVGLMLCSYYKNQPDKKTQKHQKGKKNTKGDKETFGRDGLHVLP